MSSVGAVSVAQSGRGNRFFAATADDYQVILPNLPSGRIVANTVFMHGDPRARPYRVEDYRDTLANLGALPDVVALGAYQMNHVWAVTMTTADAAQKLLLAVDVKVKDRPCLLIDPNNREVRVKLHWLLHGVTDEDVRVALSPYGKVLEVTREKWRALGVTEKGSTTRTVGLKLHADVKIDDIPHQLKIAGELTLVVVPGRAPLCLRCKSTGHIRRDCKVPRCSRCRRFGHVDADCAKTYASVAGPVQANDISDHLMDEEDSEETARTSRNLVTQGASSNFQGEQLIDDGVPEDDVKLAFAAFGKVTDVARERWRVQGMADKGFTTMLVTLKLKPGVKLDDIPHQVSVAGELALVVVPGRAPLCLRCRGTGHIRRECRIPRCGACRRFGHEDSQCERTYAKVTGSVNTQDASALLMDAADMEETSAATTATAAGETNAVETSQQDKIVAEKGVTIREPAPRQDAGPRSEGEQEGDNASSVAFF
ncbi:uncharacterized protein LOC144134536 [Amblyomma americanum]